MSPPESAVEWPLIDAHCHLHDAELLNALEHFPADRQLPAISFHISNGTHPDDWADVAAATGFCGSRLLPAYGVHPWRVDNLPGNWEDTLLEYLEKGAASIGEIGLDFWIEPRDESIQRKVFLRQLEIAADRQLPASIHCVRAYGALLDCLRGVELPERGFLAHGFGGSREVLYQLVDLGGYASFSAYGAHPGRKRIRDAVRSCPIDRLLVETDAPDMVPPEEVCRYPLASESGKRLHHPAELLTAYGWIAEIRQMDVAELAVQVQANFHRLFGDCEAFALRSR